MSSYIRQFLKDNYDNLSLEERFGLVSAEREVLTAEAADDFDKFAMAATLRAMAEAVTGEFRWGYLKAAELLLS